MLLDLAVMSFALLFLLPHCEGVLTYFIVLLKQGEIRCTKKKKKKRKEKKKNEHIEHLVLLAHLKMTFNTGASFPNTLAPFIEFIVKLFSL